MVDLTGVVLAQGFTITRTVIFTGVMSGLMIGILAAGLVLVYRSSRVINFAYGEVGVFGATFMAYLVLNLGWNFWPALLLACLTGAVISMVIELVVVRRLFNAPRVVLFAATLGVSQLMLAATLQLPDLATGQYPSPFFVQPSRANPDATYSLFGFDVPFEIAGIRIGSREMLVILLVPLVAVLLGWFLSRTLYGLCVRASASNADAARLAGVSPKLMSTLVWTIAGALAVMTAALLFPLLSIKPQGAAVVEAIGPALLLRALAAALIGFMRSIPRAMVGGVLVGVSEAIITFNVSSDRLLLNRPGFFMALLFVVVLGLVLMQARSGETDDEGVWSFSPRVRPIPDHIKNASLFGNLPRIVGLVALAVGILLPFWMTAPSKLIILSTALIWAMVGLSVTILTGWAGQLSLGQFALAGLGAMTMGSVRERGIPFPGGRLFDDGVPFVVAIVIAVAVTVVAAMIIGAPALRVKGLFLAVTTLAFAVACSAWFFDQEVFLPEGQTSLFVPRPSLLDSERVYYWMLLAVLAVLMIVMARLRRGGIGRSLIAVRDNERSASAFTVQPARSKFTAFAIGGGLAGLGGALLTGLTQNANPESFGVTQSLAVVSTTIVGGVSSVAGPVIGAMWAQGLPAFASFSETVNLLRSGIGLLIMLMYFPGGLVQIGYALRDAVVEWLEARSGPVDTTKDPEVAVPIRTLDRSPERLVAEPGVAALRTTGVSVRFGARYAVHEVDLLADQGEVIGLIGGNGAGKTTLMNAIGGFVPSTGEIEVLGRDISGTSPAERADLGLGRTFQAADLFGDLTVTETVQVALEARGRTPLTPALLGLPYDAIHERKRRRQAEELIHFVGLGRYANAFISELSTGTRRICELACLLALDAQVLCLDEPTAGVAQRETEAFGPLIKRIQRELDATLVVIEHDMPLIMSISDRVYCMEAGEMIAEGTPDEVRNDPLVIASYLGTDERAIARSDAG